MPLSICARVPQKTRTMDSTNRTTVSRSEATGLRTFLTEAHQPGSTRTGRGGRTGAGGLGRICTEVSFMGSSWTAVEAHRLDECLERGLLFPDQVGRPLHGDEPGAA